MLKFRCVVLLSAFVVLALSIVEAHAADGASWTQFRGPDRANRSSETGLLKEWPEDGPKLLWTARGLGEGFSSVSLADGVLYTMGLKGEDEMVHAVDLETGKLLWSQRNGGAYRNGQGNGPRGTPSIDGDRLYALGANGDLSCRKRETGDVIWQGNILKEFNGENIRWGISESPLVDGDNVIVTPGGKNGTIVALDKNSGQVRWRAQVPNDPQAGYASAVPIEVGGVRQYVTFTHKSVVGVRASDGKVLWGDDKAANGTANCSAPLFYENLVFSSSGYGTGCSCVEVTGTGATHKYFNKDLKSHHGGLFVLDGYIYGTDERIMTCMEIATGKVAWKSRSVGKGSVTYADGHIYLRSETGPVALIEANPKEYVEKGRFEPPKSERRSWAHPVVVDGKLFLRDQDFLLCYDVSGK